MAYETVIYQPGPVARVILNRPEVQNAQSWTLLSEMEDAFEDAVADPECRIIVLSGEGESFSAGHDLDSPDQVAERKRRAGGRDPFARSEIFTDVYIDSHLRWRDMPKPTVAMVHGKCIFGGWMIASAMDCIFASDDALFIPVYGDYFTAAWDLGARKAKEILFENRFMTATEAMEWGFVNRVYPSDELEAQTLKFARRVAEHDALTLRTIKNSINHTLDQMGFTISVRAIRPEFQNMIARMRPRRREGEPSEPERRPAGSPFRSQVARALEYLREDRDGD